MDKIFLYGNTHAGRLRPANEDASIMLVLRPDDKVLAAVIDGVGGYAGGERAAAIAKDCIEQYMQTPSGDAIMMLREAVIFANNQIAAERKKDPRCREMCCVLTALVADTLSRHIYFVHVGDTRLYRYRDGKLQKLTRDHSFVGIREDAGEISESEAMAHPHRNQILREVGSGLHRLDDEDFMDYGKDDFLPGDLLLLCSDGLTDMVHSQQLAGELASGHPLQHKSQRLVEMANEYGGHDNITVVLLQYPGIEESAKPANGKPAFSRETAMLPAQVNKKNKYWLKSIVWSAFLLVIMAAAAGWYFISPQKNSLPFAAITTAQNADSIKSDSTKTRSMARNTPIAVPSQPDTLHISSTQNFADLKKYTDSTGKTLVLVPANNKRHFAAISVTARSASSGDTLLIRNIHLTGFDTGIDIHLPVLLRAENLVFENTTMPFRYCLKPGEKQPSVLFIQTIKL